jgi:hypothetical protein
MSRSRAPSSSTAGFPEPAAEPLDAARVETPAEPDSCAAADAGGGGAAGAPPRHGPRQPAPASAQAASAQESEEWDPPAPDLGEEDQSLGAPDDDLLAAPEPFC